MKGSFACWPSRCPNCLDHSGRWLEHLFQSKMGRIYRTNISGRELWPWLEQAVASRMTSSGLGMPGRNAVLHNAPYLLQCRLRRADGIYRWWLIHGVPVLGENGNIIKWYGTCTDINDLKQTEDALRENERFLSGNPGSCPIGGMESKPGKQSPDVD